MSISIQGALETVITLKGFGDLQVGDIVTMHSNNTVKKISLNDEICGVVTSKSGEYVGVKIAGAARVTIKENLKLGFQSILGSTGNAIYPVSGATRNIFIVNVDIANKLADIILI